MNIKDKYSPNELSKETPLQVPVTQKGRNSLAEDANSIFGDMLYFHENFDENGYVFNGVKIDVSY